MINYIKGSFRELTKTKTLIIAALLIAINIILTRFLSFETQFLRIGFGFLPVAICGLLFGPVVSGFSAAIADLIGIFLFPKASFFPGFTITQFLYGAIYGFWFYKRKVTLSKIMLAVLCVSLFLDIGLNTLWLSILYGKGYIGLLPARTLKTATFYPIQVILIYSVNKILSKAKINI